MSGSEYCRHCGYPWDAHRDYDGACPTCDDDAAANLADNVPIPTHMLWSATPQELLARIMAHPGARYELMLANDDIVELWPPRRRTLRTAHLAREIRKALRVFTYSN